MDATDVISVNSAKNWLNIEASYTDDDATITRLIKSAVDWVERYTSYYLYPRSVTLYNRQVPNFNPANYFPVTGSGTWNGTTNLREIPDGLSIYIYPFTITSVKDKDGADVIYNTILNPLKTLLYALPNSIIIINAGYATVDEIPPILIEVCYKLITYFYENRDSYKAEQPTDIQVMLNQYRRVIA